MLACGEGRRRRGRLRRRRMDEIHEVTGMKLAELRDVTTERKQGRRLATMVAEFQERTAQGDKVTGGHCCVIEMSPGRPHTSLLCCNLCCNCNTSNGMLNFSVYIYLKRRLITLRIYHE